MWVGRGGEASAFCSWRASRLDTRLVPAGPLLSSTRAIWDRSGRLIFTTLRRQDHAQDLGEAEARLAQLSQSLTVGPVRIVSRQRDRPGAFATRLGRPRIDRELRERAAGQQERLGRPLRRPR